MKKRSPKNKGRVACPVCGERDANYQEMEEKMEKMSVTMEKMFSILAAIERERPAESNGESSLRGRLLDSSKASPDSEDGTVLTIKLE